MAEIDIDTLIEKQQEMVRKTQDSLLAAATLSPDQLRSGAEAIDLGVGVLLRLQDARGSGTEPQSFEEIIASLREKGIVVTVPGESQSSTPQ